MSHSESNFDTQHPDDEGLPVTGRSARARFAILKALNDLGATAGASKIAEMLSGTGVQLQARSVRFHLMKMDSEGLTCSFAKHEGRQITDAGRKELTRISILRKVGFIGPRIDELGYRMSLDTEHGTGSVIANVVAIHKRDLSRSLYYIRPVFASGLGMGDRIAVKMTAGRIGEATAPRGKLLISTICSATVNGLFLKAGIPVVSRFGGLIEIDSGRPKRFVELAEYHGTSIDPYKIFILANMTSVGKCANSGSGIVGACFHEFPTVALENARNLVSTLGRLNLNGILAIGQPNQPLLDIPVSEGRTGMITLDGLNPIAALHEAGIPVEITPLSGLEELNSFVPFKDVASMGRRSTFVD